MKEKIFIRLTATWLLVFFVATVHAQFSVEPVLELTPQQLVDSMLKGDGVIISNAKFNRTTTPIVGNNVGIFNNLYLYAPNDYFGRGAVDLPSGRIFSTGAITKATTEINYVPATPSNEVGGSITGDTNLISVGATTANNIRSLTMLEFDFIANAAFVSLNYIFASAEYPQYVGSFFNDIFAFHITGRDPVTLVSTMHRNISLIPNSLTYVTVNTVNNGNSTGYGSSNPQYFFDNRNNAYTNSIKYGGFTVAMTANAILIPYQSYHLSLSIADVGDNIMHSAVFFKKGSLQSSQAEISTDYENSNNDTLIPEHNTAFINLLLPQPNTDTTYATLTDLGGAKGATALWGKHYQVYDMANESEFASSNTLIFAPASVVMNNGMYAFSGGDTLNRLKIAAIQDSIQPDEVLFAKIGVSINSSGISPVNGFLYGKTDTLTFILKRYIAPAEPDYISNTTLANSVKLYPNPASEKLTVNINSPFNSLEISNLMGQTIYSTTITNEQIEIDLTNFRAGLYFVRLRGNDGNLLLKFVKR
jgi:hypothetical protein